MKEFMNEFTDPDYKSIVWFWQQKNKFLDIESLEILTFLIYHEEEIIGKVLWHSSEDIIIRRLEDTNQ